MAKYVKIHTDCNFCGCDTMHYVIVSDGADVDSLAQELVEQDISPTYECEEMSEEEFMEEMENDGYEVEEY